MCWNKALADATHRMEPKVQPGRALLLVLHHSRLITQNNAMSVWS